MASPWTPSSSLTHSRRWNVVVKSRSITTYPAVEWVVYFKNNGDTDSPILSDVLPLDILFRLDAALPCQVHHARGASRSGMTSNRWKRPSHSARADRGLHLSARTGKSSTIHLPFFNLQLGSGGVIGAIGWSGGWAATFQRQRDGIRVRAGMERTHLRLHPGEEIRTPRILLLFWQGPTRRWQSGAQDRIRSHNVFRRLLLAHYTPRPNGQLLQPPFCDGVWGAQPETNHLAKSDGCRKTAFQPSATGSTQVGTGIARLQKAADGLSSGWMRQVGSWFPNPVAYPRGFQPIGDAAREQGWGSSSGSSRNGPSRARSWSGSTPNGCSARCRPATPTASTSW